jgi:hypothetical protein
MLSKRKKDKIKKGFTVALALLISVGLLLSTFSWYF